MQRAARIVTALAVAFAIPTFGERGQTLQPSVTSTSREHAEDPPPRHLLGRVPSTNDPFAVLSGQRLFGFLDELTAIGSTSLWRNSASRGEAEALEYVARTLGGFATLHAMGLSVERPVFRTYLATELWEARLELEVAGQRIEVPAHGLQGHRSHLGQAMRFDSDGVLNDSDRDPVAVDGPVVVVRSRSQVLSLTASQLAGRLVLLDYAAVDRSVVDPSTALDTASELLARGPAGLVLVTTFSNTRGESHGTFVGDVSVLVSVEEPSVPTLYARIEDLAPAGVAGWADLDRVDAARVTWDADVSSPGTSGSLIARLPGTDPSRAVILGAHLDSPNSPGALDNGSGSAALLEVARVLDATRTRPAVDLYLCWFGSHERGLYGSQDFLLDHQELLDRTLGMQQMDCLTRPLDGFNARLYLEAWSYLRHGDDSTPWGSFVSQAASSHGASASPLDYLGLVSDNTSFNTFDVPNSNLIFMDIHQMTEVHYDGHLHDPYDTASLARDEADTLDEMARIVLAAALETAELQPELRVTPVPDRRAVVVSSHTEAVHMAASNLIELGMTLAWEGFDVDVVPYGQPVSSADLGDADLVVVLPVHDYPDPGGDVGLYDEAWTAAEVAALTGYVEQGGFLVLTNSAHRLQYFNTVYEENEDWDDQNQLAAHFAITYLEGTLAGNRATPAGGSPLLAGVTTLEMASNNGIPLHADLGQVLAQSGGRTAMALTTFGQGEVLALADVGILGARATPLNLTFWRNLAEYARRR